MFKNQKLTFIIPILLLVIILVYNQEFLKNLLTGQLWRDFEISLIRVITSMLVSFVSGSIIAYLLYHYKIMNQVFSGSFCFIKQVSPFAWLPLIIIFWGIGELAVFMTMLISMIFPAIIFCRDVYQKLPKSILDEAFSAGSEGIYHLTHILIPLSIPGFIACLRLLWSIGWHTIIAAEMLGVSDGIGFRLLDFRFLYRYNEMLIYIFLIGSLGFLVDGLLQYFEHKLHHEYNY